MDRYGDAAQKDAAKALEMVKLAQIANERLDRINAACYFGRRSPTPVPGGTTPPEDRTIIPPEDVWKERQRLVAEGGGNIDRAITQWEAAKSEMERAEAIVKRYVKPAPDHAGGKPMDPVEKYDWQWTYHAALVSTMEHRAYALRYMAEARTQFAKARTTPAPAPKPAAKKKDKKKKN